MRLSTLFATFGLALMMTLALPAQTVRVIFVSGQASMQRPDEAALRPAVKGETVIIGTRIVTGADGRVVLTPMPGVKSIITPNTTLLLESVSETRVSATEVTHQAVLDLKQGAVVSDLQKPEGVTYDYSIRTARGLAGARGTTFTVGINAAGIQTIVVAHGSISISFADGSKAVLSPGQLSITKPNGETQSVNNISELPEADQAVAQNWTETTITAIATALEAGIELDPTALTNAVAASTSLGITLSPETQASVDRALATAPKETTAFETEESAAPLTTTMDDSNDPKPTEIVTQTSTPSAIDVFRPLLTATQQVAFDALPVSIQGQLATLNDLTVAGVALAPDSSTGLPLTYEDLSIHLGAFIQLPADSFAFIKTLASASDDGLTNAPDPLRWSNDAFQRTLGSWTTLTTAEQAQIIALGAGEAIMDTSAGYISALLASLDTTSSTLIAAAGWGPDLEELAGKPTAVNILTAAGSLSGTELATVKFFEISPHFFQSPDAMTVVQTLTALSSSDQQILRQLGVGHMITDTMNSETPHDYPAEISNVLNFYAALNTEQQTATRALGIGWLLYASAPDATVGDGSVTALQRVQTLAQFYIDHPTLRQALQDTRLFENSKFLFSSTAPDLTLITDTLAIYQNLPTRTRVFLTSSDKGYDFFLLANPTTGTTGTTTGTGTGTGTGTTLTPGFSPTYRTLDDINSLLAGLSVAEFDALRDLDLGRAIIEKGEFGFESFHNYLGDTPLATLKATIAGYTQLDTNKKFVLRELGIVGDGNIAIIGADTEGLDRLLTAYGSLPGTLRAATEQLNEEFSSYSTYGNTGGPVQDRSFFFPNGYRENTIMQSVGFQSTGDLHVGATRYLRIDGTYRDGDTFIAGANRDVYLHASDLIDLNATGFSAGIRSITMAAATINLSNLTIPEGAVASFNARLNEVVFLGSGDPVSTTNGKINFKNVFYGDSPLNSAADLTSSTGARGNIVTGTLKNPAPLPTYTPKLPL